MDRKQFVTEIARLLSEVPPAEAVAVLEQAAAEIDGREYLTVQEACRALRLKSRSALYERARRAGVLIAGAVVHRADLKRLHQAGRRPHGRKHAA